MIVRLMYMPVEVKTSHVVGPKNNNFFFLINDAVCGYWPLDSHSSVSPQFSRKQETAEAQYLF